MRTFVRLRSACVLAHNLAGRFSSHSGIPHFTLMVALLALAACMGATFAFGQIQSTTSCSQGQWDVLSVMMMDPGLAEGYHMEGLTNGSPSAYIYTQWDSSQNKLYYTKNPQGNPWDINLYDSDYIYQWVTELQTWKGTNHWNDPRSCKKFNSGSQTSKSDYSMRWASRCAAPGGTNSAFWNPPPTTQPNNTNYYTYVDQDIQSQSQNLGYSKLSLNTTSTMNITDHRAVPPKTFSITTLPLGYTYSCTEMENVNSCKSREVFAYGLDTTVNPVDHVKHSYGWVSWRYYTNSTGGNPKLPAVWVLSNHSITDQLMAGQVSVNFQCFP